MAYRLRRDGRDIVLCVTPLQRLPVEICYIVEYSPTWIDGKKHARNVYAHMREECEEKLKVLIAEMKAELAELKKAK